MVKAFVCIDFLSDKKCQLGVVLVKADAHNIW